MEIKAVQFTDPSPNVMPDCLHLRFEGPQELEGFQNKAPVPCGLVVTRDALSEFKKFKDLVLYRGWKNKNKGLAPYLLGRDPSKILLIGGTYDSSGRLAQGMRAMISHAAHNGQPALFAVGVDDDVFAQLWAGSAKHNLRSPQPGKGGDRAPCTVQENDIFSWLIQELGVQCQVPQELREIYIGDSDEADLVRRLIMRAAENSAPILILGDTGTGKEIVARQIHERSARGSGPFIPVNCGGIPQNLLESELFGHVQGAFTGASIDKTGLWQAAGGGTLFLDEIGELTLVNQAKILRVLEDGKIRRVGDTREIKADARIIAATNRDIFTMMKTGRFREDLYYRLYGFFIRTPALRKHPQDIAVIAQHLWYKITADRKRKLPEELIDELTAYTWPGNVRELKMVLNHLFNLFPNENLNRQHLRSVSFLAGRAHQQSSETVSEKDIALHRARCLRHLKSAHEVIDATKHTLKQVLSEQKNERSSASRLYTSLNLRIHEFEKLCREPLLFYGQKTFNDVNNLKGRITWLLGLMRKKPKDARKYWTLEVADSFRIATNKVFEEIEKLMAES